MDSSAAAGSVALARRLQRWRTATAVALPAAHAPAVAPDFANAVGDHRRRRVAIARRGSAGSVCTAGGGSRWPSRSGAGSCGTTRRAARRLRGSADARAQDAAAFVSLTTPTIAPTGCMRWTSSDIPGCRRRGGHGCSCGRQAADTAVFHLGGSRRRHEAGRDLRGCGTGGLWALVDDGALSTCRAGGGYGVAMTTDKQSQVLVAGDKVYSARTTVAPSSRCSPDGWPPLPTTSQRPAGLRRGGGELLRSVDGGETCLPSPLDLELLEPLRTRTGACWRGRHRRAREPGCTTSSPRVSSYVKVKTPRARSVRLQRRRTVVEPERPQVADAGFGTTMVDAGAVHLGVAVAGGRRNSMRPISKYCR